MKQCTGYLLTSILAIAFLQGCSDNRFKLDLNDVCELTFTGTIGNAHPKVKCNVDTMDMKTISFQEASKLESLLDTLEFSFDKEEDIVNGDSVTATAINYKTLEDQYDINITEESITGIANGLEEPIVYYEDVEDIPDDFIIALQNLSKDYLGEKDTQDTIIFRYEDLVPLSSNKFEYELVKSFYYTSDKASATNSRYNTIIHIFKVDLSAPKRVSYKSSDLTDDIDKTIYVATCIDNVTSWAFTNRPVESDVIFTKNTLEEAEAYAYERYDHDTRVFSPKWQELKVIK